MKCCVQYSLTKVLTVILLFSLALTLSSCTNKGSKTPATQDIAQMIINTCTFDELIELKNDVLYNQYDKLDKSDIKEISVYVCSSGATVDELCVIRVTSNEDIDAVKAALESRVKDLNEKFVDYVPTEIPKLDQAVIVTNGDYIMMTTTIDGDKAASEFTKMFE